MIEVFTLRELTEEEARTLRAVAHSRTTEARLRDRVRMCWLAHEGQHVSAIKVDTRISY